MSADPSKSPATDASSSDSSALRQLVARDVTRSFGARTVLAGVDLVATPGQRIGLVGENGSGKSTLLRILAGVDHADGGDVQRPPDLAYLPQDPAFADGATVGDVLRDALAPLHDMVAELERLGSTLADVPAAADRYAETLDLAVARDAWDADRRATVAASRLGVDDLAADRVVTELSGGQRTRLALAALMTTRPSCALLDEPTNHLDDDALGVLEEFLSDLPGVVVVASHDRVFLDRVCTAIVDLDPSLAGARSVAGRRYTGTFSDYLAAREDDRRRWEQTYRDQQEELGDLRRTVAVDARQVAHNRAPRDNDKYIYNFKAGNVARTISRRVRDAEQRLERAEEGQVRKPPKPLAFRGALTAVARSSGLAVTVRDLVVPGRVRVDRLDVGIGDQLLVTGPNGGGKSSLLAVLAGRLEAASGSVSVSARRVGLLSQDVTFTDPAASARDTYAAALGVDRAEARPLTELGLLHGRESVTAAGNLSVGQQRRLALAILVAAQPDLLLLDEPTNHISLALAGELEEGLGTSPGTVLVASHDRWLRRRWAGEVYPMDPRPDVSVGNVS